MEINEVIKKIQKGEKELFGELYEKYFDEIYKFIFIKTNNVETSQDLVSETFFKAYKNIDKFKVDKNSNFRAWLYRIGYNLIVDNYKKYEKKEVSLEEFFDVGYFEDIGEKIDQKDKIQKVIKYLETINPKHKEIITMRIWNDLSYSEISQITGEKVDNCKKIVSRGLKNIPKEHFILLFLLLINF